MTERQANRQIETEAEGENKRHRERRTYRHVDRQKRR